MGIRLLANSCGVAEYRGTLYNFADQVLQNYVKERGTADVGSYGNRQHTFVVMTFKKGYAEDFDDYVKAHNLGEVVSSEWRRNINHSGMWNPSKDYGDELRVVVFTPDHQKLTEWYQEKFDKNYSL